MNNVAEEMKHLNQLARRDPRKRFTRLWDNLTDIRWLAQAWEQIRRNKGSQTPGVNHTVAVDVDLEMIERLRKELKSGTYRPSPVRRVQIPKANGKTRPLGISNLEDRIVQQAIRMLLEPIFEADFLSCSHGFRQGRSTHTALREVAVAYTGSSWIIEGDVEACFDSIPRGRLVEQLKRRIADEKVLQLIWRFLEVGYLEQWKYHATYSGVPQGNILGPLLCNVFLHQLDEFVVQQYSANRVQTRRESYTRMNPEYWRLAGKIYKLRKKQREGRLSQEKAAELKELIQQQKRTPYYDKDKSYPCRVKYIRYADDWLILVVGSKLDAETIKQQVKEKLSTIGLRLHEEKTKVTHWSRSVRFLGYDIRGELRDKGVGLYTVLNIPHEKLREAEKSIEQRSSYYHIPELDALTHMNGVFTGWCNYYRYANNATKVFGKLAQTMWWSYAHYLSRKQKSSIKQMIIRERKSGRLINVQKEGRSRRTFSLMVGKKRWVLNTFPPPKVNIKSLTGKQKWEVDMRPVQPLNWQSGRSMATRMEAMERANGVCERCQERAAEQVHHKVPIRGKRFPAAAKSDRDQRYTAIALCGECHLKVHGGSYHPGGKRSVRSAEIR